MAGARLSAESRKYEAQNEACGTVGEEFRIRQSRDEVLEVIDSRVRMRRPLRSTSVNVRFFSVGRPGLDPGTLGLKGTFYRLFCAGLVAHVHCFQESVLF